MKSKKIHYTEEHQKSIVNYLANNEEILARCRTILKPDYFSGTNKKAMNYLLEFSDTYRAVPTTDDLKAQTGFEASKIEKNSKNLDDWFLKTVEQYCRHKAIENITTLGPDLLESGEYELYEKKLKEAVQIRLQSDLGMDYFDNPRQRLNQLKDRKNMVSTGWKSLDNVLYGGVNRGEITIFAGGPGSGKSCFLQNLGVNFLEQGLDVVYFTFELSESLISLRLDAMLTNYSTRDVFKQIDQVELMLGVKSKKLGKMQIKYLPSGTTCNDLRAYLKEYSLKFGKIPDVILVDYLDLMYPNARGINLNDAFTKDKFVSEELRNFAAENNSVLITASQLNRTSVIETEHNISMIAGGISKVNTADNLISIFTSDLLRERGEYLLQFLKTRSSSGVGKKLTLAYNNISLRISDREQDEDNILAKKSASDIIKKIDNENSRKQHESAGAARILTGITSLEDMLRNITPDE